MTLNPDDILRGRLITDLPPVEIVRLAKHGKTPEEIESEVKAIIEETRKQPTSGIYWDREKGWVESEHDKSLRGIKLNVDPSFFYARGQSNE